MVVSLPQRWWWIRHAPSLVAPGMLAGPDAAADVGDGAAFVRLKTQLPGDALVVTSSLKRAVMTAAALGFAETQVEPAFAEQDFGAWIGCTHDALHASGDSAYRAFWDDPATAIPPQGESFAAVIGRVRAALDRWQAPDVVVVAHGGSIRAALAVALDLQPAAALRFAVAPLSLTRISRHGSTWSVENVNQA